MPLSSNTIIHFTKTSEALKGILQTNFKIKYCQENIKLQEELHYAAPMVSFCDIPLSQIKDHIGKYGAYGIGLTKEWAQKNKLNPVLYIQSDSFLSESIDESYREITTSEPVIFSELTNGQKNWLNILRHVKNYEADFKAGFEGIIHLPLEAKFGVYTAYVYYKKLLSKLSKTPSSEIKNTRIRVPDYQKYGLFAKCYFTYKLKII